LAGIHCLAQFAGGDPLPFTGDLDVDGMWRLIAAKHYGDPAHALAANEADFYPRLVGLDGDDRGDAALHEIYSFDPSIGSFMSLRSAIGTGCK
jgi:hypothetical protein